MTTTTTTTTTTEGLHKKDGRLLVLCVRATGLTITPNVAPTCDHMSRVDTWAAKANAYLLLTTSSVWEDYE